MESQHWRKVFQMEGTYRRNIRFLGRVTRIKEKIVAGLFIWKSAKNQCYFRQQTHISIVNAMRNPAIPRRHRKQLLRHYRRSVVSTIWINYGQIQRQNQILLQKYPTPSRTALHKRVHPQERHPEKHCKNHTHSFASIRLLIIKLHENSSEISHWKI